MILQIKHHLYETHIWEGLKIRIAYLFGDYRVPKTMWVSHGDTCCDYWQPITIEDIRNDDILSINSKKETK